MALRGKFLKNFNFSPIIQDFLLNFVQIQVLKTDSYKKKKKTIRYWAIPNQNEYNTLIQQRKQPKVDYWCSN